MPAVKKITKKQHPKPSPKPARKPASKSSKKPAKKTAPKAKCDCGCSGKQDCTQKGSMKGGGCGCTGSQKGGFVDMDALAKLSVPFGLLVAKAGLEDFLKSKKTVSVKVPVKKVSVTQKTVVRSPSKKVVINRRFL